MFTVKDFVFDVSVQVGIVYKHLIHTGKSSLGLLANHQISESLQAMLIEPCNTRLLN